MRAGSATIESPVIAGLSIRHLSKSFPGTPALDDVSFDVAAGTVHALLGGNGSGKSTLIKVLAGVYQGDAGGTVNVGEATASADAITPRWAAAAGVTFVHQELGLFAPLTVAENLYAGRAYPRRGGAIAWRRIRREAQRDLDRLDIAVSADAALGSLRPADQTLIAIARALRGRDQLHAGLLVLDEPTARLPEAEVELLLGAVRRLAESGQTVLYVSHRLEEVLDVSTAVTVLRDGRLVETRAAAELDEAGLIELIVGRRLAGVGRPSKPARSSQTPALRVRGLRGGPLRGVDFDLAPREVLGIAGLVGSGRTTLLELLFGVLDRAPGSVVLHGEPVPEGDIRAAMKLGLAYVPEDRLAEGSFVDLGVAENLSATAPARYWRRMLFRHRAERADARSDIARFDIRAAGAGAALHTLSGGNQQKVAVARWLRHAPRVLLLDEPTHGVDVGARADIYAHLRQAVEEGLSIIVVSSDADELTQLADRVLVLGDGGVVAEAGSPDFDRHWLAERTYRTSSEGIAT